MIDGQSASLSWCEALIWAQDHLCHCHTVAELLMWIAHSDESTNQLFTVATGHRRRTHIYRDQRQYYILSMFTILI
jgi:hypothetical protein